MALTKDTRHQRTTSELIGVNPVLYEQDMKPGYYIVSLKYSTNPAIAFSYLQLGVVDINANAPLNYLPAYLTDNVQKRICIYISGQIRIFVDGFAFGGGLTTLDYSITINQVFSCYSKEYWRLALRRNYGVNVSIPGTLIAQTPCTQGAVGLIIQANNTLVAGACSNEYGRLNGARQTYFGTIVHAANVNEVRRLPVKPALPTSRIILEDPDWSPGSANYAITITGLGLGDMSELTFWEVFQGP